MTPGKIVYFDNAATSWPKPPDVQSAIVDYLENVGGSPGRSGHRMSIAASRLVGDARDALAELFNVDDPCQIAFTKNSTEALNIAILGWLKPGDHVITSSIEHNSVMRPLRFLEAQGSIELTVVPCSPETGSMDPDDVRRAITSRTILVSIMHANNEVGTIEPIEAVSAITRERGLLLHTDAAQSVGKIPTKVDELGVDLLSIAGHKVYAPKGVGALYVRRGVRLEPLIHGASHESGRRAGTESALLVAALGAACSLAADLRPMNEVRRLRDLFWSALQSRFGERVVLNGHPLNRLPNTLSVSFVRRVGADILAALDDVAASTGSACHAGSVELSPVLHAMGVPPGIGMGAVRFSLGRGTTEAEIHEVVERLDRALAAGVGVLLGGE